VITIYTLSILILLALSAFFSGTETSVFALDRLEARALAREGKGPLAQICRRLDLFLTTVLFLNLLANAGINVLATVITVETAGEIYLPLTGVTVTAVILILAEIGPKVVAVYFARRIAELAAWPLLFLMTVLKPVVGVLVEGARFIQRRVPWKPLPALLPEELDSLVEEAVEAEVMGEAEGRVLHNMIAFRRRPVKEFMTPRTDIVYIPLDTPPDEVSVRIRQARFARLPVTEGKDIDSVTACVHVKDILLSGNPDLRAHLRPVYFAPECMVAGALFQELREREIHLAVVVDEYGQVSGLVSVHDLIEELMGENPDEYTPESPWVARRDGKGWVINATVPVEVINRHLGLDLPSGREKTVGGFIFSLLGHLPHRGETLAWGGWEFTIQVVRRKRIAVVRVRPKEGT